MPCIHPWVSRLIYALTVLLVGGIGWASLEDPETFWAPGHLSRFHTDIKQCTQCHEPFMGPTSPKCVTCHSPQFFAANSRAEVRRFHEGVIEQHQSCGTCHVEHQGVLAPITTGIMENPHGEFIFRVSGTRACSDCHGIEVRDKTVHFAMVDNAMVQHLIRAGEGAHRPGHFSRCLTCHVGGQQDIEDDDDE